MTPNKIDVRDLLIAIIILLAIIQIIRDHMI